MSEFDPLRALRVLDEHGVRYVLIGGLAAASRGAPIATQDLDVCYERRPENMERLAAALTELGARLRVAQVDEDLPFVLDARTLAAGDTFTFVTTAGDIDVLATPSGTNGFDGLVERADRFDLGEGLEVLVASLDDLIAMKEASARPKDKSHLRVLRALAEEVEQPDP